MLSAIRLVRGAAIEILGVAAFLFVLSLARPAAFNQLAAAFFRVAPSAVGNAETSSAAPASAALPAIDWPWIDDSTARSKYVAEQLSVASETLGNLVSDHLAKTWSDAARADIGATRAH